MIRIGAQSFIHSFARKFTHTTHVLILIRFSRTSSHTPHTFSFSFASLAQVHTHTHTHTSSLTSSQLHVHILIHTHTQRQERSAAALASAQQTGKSGDYANAIRILDTALRTDAGNAQLTQLKNQMQPLHQQQQNQTRAAMSAPELSKARGDDAYKDAKFEGAVQVCVCVCVC